MSNKMILMPRELTAENGAKGLMSGEFSVSEHIVCGQCDNGDSGQDREYEACEFCEGQGGYNLKISIGWDEIKDIYAMAAKHLGVEIEQ